MYPTGQKCLTVKDSIQRRDGRQSREEVDARNRQGSEPMQYKSLLERLEWVGLKLEIAGA
jgi:hypothetical protein